MDIEYFKLHIVLNTNNNKQVELKPEMFLFDSGSVSGNGPYICSNINYSKSTLLQLSHKDQVEIFMNETKFKDFCLTSKSKKGIETSKDADKRNTIINNNIYIMLNALFPVSFPISDAVESLCPSINLLSDSLYLKLTKPAVYTHLKVDEETTVTRVAWLNVMHQHPAYKKLYEIVKKYYKKLFEYCNDKFSKNFDEKINEDSTFLEESGVEKWDWNTNMPIESLNQFIGFFKTLNIENDGKDHSIYKYKDEPSIYQTIWKLYYMFKGLKPMTADYYDFMKQYVELFINVKNKELITLEAKLQNLESKKSEESDNKIKMNLSSEIKDIERKIDAIKYRMYPSTLDEESRQKSYENQFNKSVEKELEFHFNYIKELSEYMPLKRNSINDNVKALFKDNILDTEIFVNAMQTLDSRYCTTVDKMDDGKYYEVHVGIGLVGGKVTANNAKKLVCKFDEYKLAKQIKDYTENLTAYAMYPYVDLKEYIKKLEAPIKKGGKKTRRHKQKRRRRITFKQQ